MTMLPHSLRPLLLRSVCVLVASAGITSCKTPAAGGSPYASSDGGGYNPYPGQGGSAQPGSMLPAGSRPQYTQAPPPPPPGFDGPSEHFKPAPATKPKTSVASSSGGAKKKTTASTKPSSSAKKKSSGGGSYTVKKGDTLYGLALRYKTTVAKLKAVNGLSSDLLSIGRRLKIP